MAIHKTTKNQAGQWWRTPLIPALGRQKQADLCEFEASLVYKEHVSGQAPKLKRTPGTKKQTKFSV